MHYVVSKVGEQQHLWNGKTYYALVSLGKWRVWLYMLVLYIFKYDPTLQYNLKIITIDSISSTKIFVFQSSSPIGA